MKCIKNYVLVLLLLCVMVEIRAQHDSPKMNHYIRKWLSYLDENFHMGELDGNVTTRLLPVSIFSVKIHSGGDGRYYRIFVIDDSQQVLCEFDYQSKLISTPILQPRQKWLRYPDGTGVSLAEGRSDEAQSDINDKK